MAAINTILYIFLSFSSLTYVIQKIAKTKYATKCNILSSKEEPKSGKSGIFIRLNAINVIV
jgi:hypothetical protein